MIYDTCCKNLQLFFGKHERLKSDIVLHNLLESIRTGNKPNFDYCIWCSARLNDSLKKKFKEELVERFNVNLTFSTKKGRHCCDDMNYFLNDDNKVMNYHPARREYSVKLTKFTKAIFDYCPWCGTKLPKPLDDELDNEITKTLGISKDDIDLDTYNDPRLPEEFKTDEWWKKRGL